MGLEQSKDESTPALGKSEAEIIRLMMPVYYIDAPLTDHELELANSTWKHIFMNTSDEFLERRKDPNFTHPTCIVFFYNSFYGRLFDIHPLSRDLFKDMASQGKFLVKMISLSLSEKSDPEKYEHTLTRLAEIHNERGVRAVEYGLVGEILFWSIRQCVGALYTSEVHLAWVKIYSRMLRTMVPVAVAYELRDGSAQERRFQMQTMHLMYTGGEQTPTPRDSKATLQSSQIYGALQSNTMQLK